MATAEKDKDGKVIKVTYADQAGDEASAERLADKIRVTTRQKNGVGRAVDLPLPDARRFANDIGELVGEEPKKP